MVEAIEFVGGRGTVPLALFVWLDTASGANPKLRAFRHGAPIASAGVCDDLLRAAVAGVGHLVPWLRDGAPNAVPLCGFAVVVWAGNADPERPAEAACPRVHAGVALFPSDEDRARLAAENARLLESLAAPEAAPAVPAADGAAISEVCVLDGEVRKNGAVIACSATEFKLLATLALKHHGTSRQDLADELWPDSDPSAARNLLKVYVHRVRMRLGSRDAVGVVGLIYRLGSAATSDVLVAEQLLRHGALGPALPDDVAIRLRDAYRRFLTGGYRKLCGAQSFGEIDRRIRSLGLALATALARHESERGNVDEALDVVERLFRLDPADDAAMELVLRTHASFGKAALALSRYREHCAVLRAVLDTRPAPHIANLAQALAATR